MKNEEKIEQNELDKIISAILVHRNPNMLVWDYKDKINTDNHNNKKLDEYNILLSSVNYFFKKILKYEIYFADFYPNTKVITKAEALEYHIYAYLQYMVILKNKLTTFFGVLKNDLKKIASNKQEIDLALKFIIGKIEETFNDVKKHRNPHHHKGYRFLNGDLVDSDMWNTMLKDDFPLKDRVNVKFVKQKEIESFEKAKSDYIELSRKNNEQITDLINTVVERNKDFIYKVLNIKSIKEAMDK